MTESTPQDKFDQILQVPDAKHRVVLAVSWALQVAQRQMALQGEANAADRAVNITLRMYCDEGGPLAAAEQPVEQTADEPA